MSTLSQTYLDAVANIDFNAFPDEVEWLDVIYIQSEIGGRGNKLPSGEELAVYIPKDFDSCLKHGSIRLTSKQAEKLAV
tara:strand:- start:295 stop:531 length:237 start_codon:yes stop_codon:yes gene_type:complete